MGTQTMGSKAEPKSNPLARQGSIYSLTLDEVQNQLGDLGKPLSSMNLDELLKATGMGIIEEENVVASASALHRQPSLTLSRDLSKKTVDEVWRDIQQGQQSNSNNNNNPARNVQERQPTLGEITLEDFLVKAGVVAESDKIDSSLVGVGSIPPPQQPEPAQWMQYHQLQGQPPPQPNMIPVFMRVQQPLPPFGASPILDAAYPETQIAISPSMGMLSDTQTPGRKRVAPVDVVEKTVERRQKRMIKNRESAARSRARKQAYTHELENKISRLEEENGRLKKQKEVEKVVLCAPPPEPKYQLRRTSSAPF